jgi:antitoxin component of RelBE/YafQ-DinJ toxin-antitoxin module
MSESHILKIARSGKPSAVTKGGSLGLEPGDAFNMLLAQIELRNGVPFDLTDIRPKASGICF